MSASFRLACGLLAGIASFGALAPAVSAQTVVPAPPETGEVDGNGVHLSSGDLLTARGGVSIGPANHHGLSYSQQYVDFGWRAQEVPTISGSGTCSTVSFRGESRSFCGAGGAATYPGGATLAPNTTSYTATMSDGTRITFERVSAPGGGYYTEAFYPGDSGLGYPTQVRYTDGTIWTYNYMTGQFTETTQPSNPPPECYPTLYPGYEYYCQSWYLQNGGGSSTVHRHRRLASITSNTGYQIELYYASNTVSSPQSPAFHQLTSVRAINAAVEYCDPILSCNPVNAWPTVTYSGTSTIESVIDPAGDTTAYTYSGPGGRLSAVRRPGAGTDTVSYSYNGSGQIQTVTSAGVTATYAYTGSSTTVTSPGSATQSITYGTSGLTAGMTTSRTVAGQTATFTYCVSTDPDCPVGLLRVATTPEGQTTTYSYNTRGLVTQMVQRDANGINPITTTYAYPASCSGNVACNRPTSVTDTAGNVTSYTYDPVHGGVTQVELPAPAPGQPRPTTQMQYTTHTAQAKNSSGVLTAFPSGIVMPTGSTSCRTAATCSTSVNEQVTQIAYNAATQPNLLPVSVTTKLGNNTNVATTTMTYNSLGQVLTADGPLAGADDLVTNRFDAAGRPVGSISADPDAGGALPRVAQRITYTNGLVTRQETGTVTGTSDAAWSAFAIDQQVDTEYDAYGRPVTQRHRQPGGTTQYSVTQTSYDSAGRVDCTAVRMNAPLTSTALPAACTPMTAGGAGPDRISRNVYDGDGRLVAVQSGVGTALLQNTQGIGYRTGSNQNGQVAWVEDARGGHTTYSYDAFGRRTRTNYPHPLVGGSSSTSDFDQVSYDSIGRITGFRSRRGEQFTFAFDNLGRVTSVVVPERAGLDPTHTRDVFYGYDLMGNMEYARFDGTGGPGVTNTWNALGQLIASSTAMEGGARTLTYGYDAAGRLSSLQHPDGATFTYLYDVMNRPTTLRNPAAQNLVTWNYTAQGRLSSRTADNNAADTVYAYDTAGRLASLGLDHASATYDASWSFSYNPAGQIALETRTNDGFAFNAYATTNIAYVANNLNQYTSLTPTSGAASTITHDTNGNLTGDGTTTYVYDTENRLVYATNTSGTATLRYDPLGRLYEVTSPNGNKRRLFYSGQDLVVEYDGGSTMLGRYVHGLSGGDDPLVQYTGSSTALADTYFYASDPRGSIVLTGRIDGTNTTINAYDDYGVHSSGATGRFRYTGQAWVPEVGLLYYKARMYSPTLGRFMQTDPIGYADGMNMYAYVGNDPVNGVDPTGLQIEVTVTAIIDNQPSTPPQSGLPAECNFSASCYSWGPNTFLRGENHLPQPLPGGCWDNESCTDFSEMLERIRSQASKLLCEAGNQLALASDVAGSSSLATGGLGAVITVAGFITPGVPDGEGVGVAMLSAGAHMGNVAGVLQILSGLAQGVSTGDFGNTNSGLVGMGLGILADKAWSATVPPAPLTRGGRLPPREFLQVLGKIHGYGFAIAQQQDARFAPQQVSCPPPSEAS